MSPIPNKPHPFLSDDRRACEQMLANPDPLAEGWCNTATWTFSLYFLQERANYEALCQIIRNNMNADGSLHPHAYKAAKMAMEVAYNLRKMEPFDGDETGYVNIREIVDTLAAELKEGKPPFPRK